MVIKACGRGPLFQGLMIEDLHDIAQKCSRTSMHTPWKCGVLDSEERRHEIPLARQAIFLLSSAPCAYASGLLNLDLHSWDDLVTGKTGSCFNFLSTCAEIFDVPLVFEVLVKSASLHCRRCQCVVMFVCLRMPFRHAGFEPWHSHVDPGSINLLDSNGGWGRTSCYCE